MQSYYIQYPSIFPSCVSSRLIVNSNNLVKRDLNCSKESEKSIKQDSKYYSRGGVPQAYLILKSEGYNVCVSVGTYQFHH